MFSQEFYDRLAKRLVDEATPAMFKKKNIDYRLGGKEALISKFRVDRRNEAATKHLVEGLPINLPSNYNAPNVIIYEILLIKKNKKDLGLIALIWDNEIQRKVYFCQNRFVPFFSELAKEYV